MHRAFTQDILVRSTVGPTDQDAHSGGHAHTTSSYRAPLQLLLIALEARIDRKVLGAEPVHLLLTLLDLGSWAVQLDLVERRRRLE